MPTEPRETPEYEKDEDFLSLSREPESFFAVSPDSSMTCLFPYYDIESVTHVIGKTGDRRKNETLCIVLGEARSIVIQGTMLCNVRFALQERTLRHLRPGRKKVQQESDLPLVISSIEITVLEGNL